VENVIQSYTTNTRTNTGAGQFAVSSSGSFLYAAGGVVPDLKNYLIWVDQRGMEQPAIDLQFPYHGPRISPDGQRIAFLAQARDHHLWVYDLRKGTSGPLTGGGKADYAIWTPDGKRLVFAWVKSLGPNLFWQAYDGSTPMERLGTSEYPSFPGSWSSDGKSLALVESHRGTEKDISILDVRSGRVTPFLNSPFTERYPEFSPDGRWLAYSSNESKNDEVYVRPFPGSGMRHQVSSEGGIEPLWARDGKQLFYRTWQDKVWVVDVRPDGGFHTSKPRPPFEKPGYSHGDPIRGFDLSLDGKRFLMVKLDQRKPTPVTEMILVQNCHQKDRGDDHCSGRARGGPMGRGG
jgi:eukaryotic-like serine/threonine-protein kinase